MARETFAELLCFVEQNFNTGVAQKVANSINEYVNLLCTFPHIGYIDEKLSTDKTKVCLINCKKNVIYYAIDNKTVIIIAIFDTRRNPIEIKRQIHTFIEK